MAHLGANDIAERLAERAEAFCRIYLTAGHKEGRYWRVGDIRNTPGTSTYVRLQGPLSGKGAAGKWTDAATGEHGNLLDAIREVCGLADFKAVLAEARRFLSLPDPEPVRDAKPKPGRTHLENREAAQRLYAMALPLACSLADTYLRGRALIVPDATGPLRFHPRCYHKTHDDQKAQVWPAMIAAVTDLDGHVTGAHRTWLRRDGLDKAPLDTPRKAMGEILGHAIRFGQARDVLAAGEGIETVRSLSSVAPDLPLAAATSSSHLAAIAFPPELKRLYIVRDNDAAGDEACDTLVFRCQAAGIEPIVLWPQLNDFNDDLRQLGSGALRERLRLQLAPQDVERFLAPD
ncbi:toprim domain-containing protein [Asticcacaulis sp. EMRT-3]|uniref:DUF7146 domain-containing protein n=1 Tax=Asticcacaulis sp. EMRT-3 TaxID=3040349 RepID=UPI0024AEB260|nr:toprim domain-containing protein [Asticcacaulis sp. EMRT-3]MDI7776593.1 toprim domain-containing protein [Asticcacaulis sp. EMRT-3]